VAWLSTVSARFGEHDRTECARPKRFELLTARFVVSGAISRKQELARRREHPVGTGGCAGDRGIQKNFPARVAETVSKLAPATPIEVCFQDEMRLGQKDGLV